MAGYNDLVDVTFQDATNHVATSSDDIMGLILPYFWGPVGTPRVYDVVSFFETFPESLPLNSTFNAAAQFFNAYANAKQFFRNGGSFIEVVRPKLGAKFRAVSNLSSGGTYWVALKYRGSIPANLLPSGCKSVKIESNETIVTVYWSSKTNPSTTDWEVLEQWTGQWTDELAQANGQYTHFTKVLRESQLIQAFPKNASTDSANIEDCSTDGKVTGAYVFVDIASTASGSDWVQEITDLSNQLYRSCEESKASMVMSPYNTNTLADTLVDAAKVNQTITFVGGWDIAQPLPHDTTITYPLNSKRDKFSVGLLGKEYVNIFGYTYLTNCVGGFIGATFRIAKEIRLNQPASARVYGSYEGTLADSLPFDDVLAHHKAGFITIFSSSKGPQIFGIHNSLYASAPNSYFSLWNVIRVTAAILKLVKPLAFDAIHSDTAANPVSRAVFETSIDTIVKRFSANQNLQPDSEGICSAAMNTDYLTRGGKELNAMLRLHFIGLTEKVNIKIVATDSSVTAELD